MRRRELIKTLSVIYAAGTAGPALAETLSGEVPWKPGLAADAVPASGAGQSFFTPAEADLMGAIADRLIPADEISIGAREAGCVTFIDRQLAGPFGKALTQYREGPFEAGTVEQGPQSALTPADYYRKGLAALEAHCSQTHGKPFAALPPEQQDQVLGGLEEGSVKLADVEASALFILMLQNVREGFFADPIYGGNKGMAGWKMLGFPGARYDFRHVVDRRGEKLDIPPISLSGAT